VSTSQQRPKRVLKARNLPTQDKRPTCPLHDLKMPYNIDELRWECPRQGCAQVVFPKATVENGRPVLGRGEVELFRMLNPDTGQYHYLLRSSENNVMIDITENMTGAVDSIVGSKASFGVQALIAGDW